MILIFNPVMSQLILKSRNQHNFENSEHYSMQTEQLIYLVNYLLPHLFTKELSPREPKCQKRVVVRVWDG